MAIVEHHIYLNKMRFFSSLQKIAYYKSLVKTLFVQLNRNDLWASLQNVNSNRESFICTVRKTKERLME